MRTIVLLALGLLLVGCSGEDAVATAVCPLMGSWQSGADAAIDTASEGASELEDRRTRTVEAIDDLSGRLDSLRSGIQAIPDVGAVGDIKNDLLDRTASYTERLTALRTQAAGAPALDDLPDLSSLDLDVLEGLVDCG